MLSHSLPERTRTDPPLLSQKQKLSAHEWQDIRTTAQIAQATQKLGHPPSDSRGDLLGDPPGYSLGHALGDRLLFPLGHTLV